MHTIKKLSEIERLRLIVAKLEIESEYRLLPADIDYNAITSLRLEARDKMLEIHPLSLEQASHISGVSPADIAVLMIWMEQNRANDPL